MHGKKDEPGTSRVEEIEYEDERDWLVDPTAEVERGQGASVDKMLDADFFNNFEDDFDESDMAL
jgi:hypothetical protein